MRIVRNVLVGAILIFSSVDTVLATSVGDFFKASKPEANQMLIAALNSAVKKINTLLTSRTDVKGSPKSAAQFDNDVRRAGIIADLTTNIDSGLLGATLAVESQRNPKADLEKVVMLYLYNQMKIREAEKPSKPEAK